MRLVVGSRIVECSDEEFDALRARYEEVVLDLGTGDGKHAYQLAGRRPNGLVVGLDAAKDNMRRVSAKAAAKPTRGGLANLRYVWAGAEALPPALREITELHVMMPWGSLLRGVLGSDVAMLRGLAAACVPGARLWIALNLRAWRPPVPEVGEHPEPTPDSAIETLCPLYAAAGWSLESARYLDAEEIACLTTSWTRRLNSSRDRFEVLELTGRARTPPPV
jgi:16S rRNA (adenine(1408)-N(1))-methyltransferase